MQLKAWPHPLDCDQVPSRGGGEGPGGGLQLPWRQRRLRPAFPSPVPPTHPSILACHPEWALNCLPPSGRGRHGGPQRQAAAFGKGAARRPHSGHRLLPSSVHPPHATYCARLRPLLTLHPCLQPLPLRQRCKDVKVILRSTTGRTQRLEAANADPERQARCMGWPGLAVGGAGGPRLPALFGQPWHRTCCNPSLGPCPADSLPPPGCLAISPMPSPQTLALFQSVWGAGLATAQRWYSAGCRSLADVMLRDDLSEQTQVGGVQGGGGAQMWVKCGYTRATSSHASSRLSLPTHLPAPLPGLPAPPRRPAAAHPTRTGGSGGGAGAALHV